MALRGATRIHKHAPTAVRQPGHQSDRLRNPEHRAVLPPAVDPGDRAGGAYPAGKAARSVSVLAGKLAPFLGEREAELAARQLIDAFGTPSAVLLADDDSLAHALAGSGDDAARLIRAARDLFDAALFEDLSGTKLDTGDLTFRRWIALMLRPRRRERMLALFLAAGGRLLDHRVLAPGAAENVTMDFRALVERALALEASGIVLAHNHPSGDALPSRADIAATAQVRALCRALDIDLVDHLIVAGREIFSFRDGGLL